MVFFDFKQKTAYERRMSDWSSDVCSSDLDMQATQLIYIHGFNSSPLSAKAQQLQQYCVAQGLVERLSVPALPPSPADAIRLLEAELAQHESVALVGSDRKSVVSGKSLSVRVVRVGCRIFKKQKINT